MSTFIDSIELHKLSIPLKEPFIISLGPIHEVQNVIVIIRTRNGCAGYGECSPFMSINGESMDTCYIVGQYFKKVLMDTNAIDIEGAHTIMDKTIYGNSSIKSAFDIALYDIASQHAGLPLYQFLGGEKTKTLHTDYTVSIGDKYKMAADAQKLKDEGYPAIKVKLGENLEKDVARIKAIRDQIGLGHPLRIDANQGWNTADNAIAVLQALATYNIEYCEEPINRHRFMELARVTMESPIRVMADESLGDENDAQRLVDLKACTMFNIKLGKSSGIFRAEKVAAIGEKAGIEMQVGGFMESRLGMTAAAHFALSNKAIRHCDFDTPLMYSADPVIGGLKYREGGLLEVPDVPGLGAVVDEEYLK